MPASRVATRMSVGCGLEYGPRRDAALEAAAEVADRTAELGIAVLEAPQPLHHAERLLGEAARGVGLGVDAEPVRLGALPAGAYAEQHSAFGQMIEQVHALDQPHRMIERDGEHAEADIAVARNQRRDVGRELHRI